MKKFSASTTMSASPDTVWNILVDAPGYPAWDKTMERIDGRNLPDLTENFQGFVAALKAGSENSQ